MRIVPMAINVRPTCPEHPEADLVVDVDVIPSKRGRRGHRVFHIQYRCDECGEPLLAAWNEEILLGDVELFQPEWDWLELNLGPL